MTVKLLFITSAMQSAILTQQFSLSICLSVTYWQTIMQLMLHGSLEPTFSDTALNKIPTIIPMGKQNQ